MYLVPLLTKRCQPNIGITQRMDKPHAKPIRNKARVRVRLPRYWSGDVIDQYRSRLKVRRLKIEAVEAVKSTESQIWQRRRPKRNEAFVIPLDENFRCADWEDWSSNSRSSCKVRATSFDQFAPAVVSNLLFDRLSTRGRVPCQR